MSVDQGGRGGQVPLRIWSRGLMQIVPSDFCHIGTKRAFCSLQNTPKSVFAGELTTLPRPPRGLEREHPLPHLTPLSTDPTSALVMRPPQNSSQIYAYSSKARSTYIKRSNLRFWSKLCKIVFLHKQHF